MNRNDLFEVIQSARIILFMGEKDTGKTTLITQIANHLFRGGARVGIVDADVGQSVIGPPTTVGFGEVTAELTRLSDAALRRFAFVGAITPKGNMLQHLLATRQMVDAALACGMEKILIDTTGFVAGHAGRLLKEQKIAAVSPDVILCAQRGDECEHILRQYARFARPRILRVAPAAECGTKSSAFRQNYRAAMFRQHFAAAREITCSLAEIGIFDSILLSGRALAPEQIASLAAALAPEPENAILWAERLENELTLVTTAPLGYADFARLKGALPNVGYINHLARGEMNNLLLGALDRHGNCLALAVLRSLVFQAKSAALFTSAPPDEIAGLQWSRFQMNMDK